MRTVQSLFRYPIKGLSPEPLADVALRPGQGFALDRAFAFTNGGWAYEAASYKPRPKSDFLMLMQHERLASLRTHVDESERKLSVAFPADDAPVTVQLDDDDSLQALADRIGGFVEKPLPGRPAFIRSTGTAQLRFTDVSVVSATLMNSVSLINLATVRDLERVIGTPVDPLRFRANIYFDGGEPWEELDWVGKEIGIGSIPARALLRTKRCAATNVDPATGARDLGIPQALIKNFRHGDLGVYVEILGKGKLVAGDHVESPAS